MFCFRTNYNRTLKASNFDLSSLVSRRLLNALAPSGRRSRLSILIYHRVLPQQDALFPEEIDEQEFDDQIGLLKSCFNILPLDDAVRAIQEENLPERPACITFDDGYADNAEIAVPILQKHGLTATFFIATGFLDGGRMWNDTVIELVRRAPGPLIDFSTMGFGTYEIASVQQRQQAISSLLSKLKYLPMELRQAQVDAMCRLVRVTLPTDLMMTSEQIRTIHNMGMGIGGHTANHPILAHISTTDARSEIANGKEALEAIIRAPVRLFAYPNGKPNQDYLPEHVAMVRQIGFKAAVSTAWGVARGSSNLFELPRFTPWDRSHLRFTLRMAQNMLKKAQTV
jgi:peptidoglycan/xylan/chitin deacetylase (PgdA/CDA1 family)